MESLLDTIEPKIAQDELDLLSLTLNSCKYMQKLVDMLNIFYKLDHENLKLNYEKFDLVKLIKNSIDEIKILLKYQELDISFDQKSEIIINADKLQIKRVIDNLLSNSLNYAFKNTLIKVNCKIKQGSAIFTLENKSPYIEAKALKEIFQKYKTQNSPYNRNGVGLGLYLSSEIIKSHQGQMIAKSFENNSNTFGFIIPV